MIIVKNPEACTRCFRCAMGCSYHHVHKFSLNFSSIEVRIPLLESERKPRIIIHGDDQGGRPACDSCVGEDSPFCLRFCFENVFQVAR
jgi:Fe-S-cluster-containing hydrogenase component 2